MFEPRGKLVGGEICNGACMAEGEPYGRLLSMPLPFIGGAEYRECSDPCGESARSTGIWDS